MATRPEDLYEQDFYAWTQVQARALRRLHASRPNIDLDWPHLIEEVRDLGRSERNAVRSQVKLTIEPCLKLEYSPASDPRPGWYETIEHARSRLEDQLSLTLRRDLQRNLKTLFVRARRLAERSLRRYGEVEAADALQEACPYRLADLLDPDWFPKSRHGLTP